MKTTIISGSHRPASNSERVGKYIEKTIRDQFPEDDVTLFSLKNNPLPLWNEEVWSGKGELHELWKPYGKRLSNTDNIVLISPEWHGMVPAGLKNFLLYCSAKEVGFKSTLLVSVSTGVGGAYPINELRTSGYKNSRLAILPEHIIVRKVNDMLHGEDPASEDDKMLRARILYTIRLMREFGRGLGQLRDKELIDYDTWANGM